MYLPPLSKIAPSRFGACSRCGLWAKTAGDGVVSKAEVGWTWLLLGKAWDVVINFPSWSIRVRMYLTQMSWVRTTGLFLEGWYVEQCIVLLQCCCSWLMLESKLLTGLLACVHIWSMQWVCSGSAALETVFDFCKAYLKHFWRCCVPFPVHHPLICEKQSFLLGVTATQAVPRKMLFSCFSLCLPNG